MGPAAPGDGSVPNRVLRPQHEPAGIGGPVMRGIAVALLGAFAGLALLAGYAVVGNPAADTDSDGFAFWTFARFLAGHPARALYDPGPLHVFQLQLQGAPDAVLPYVYPPGLLLLLWPLRHLGLVPFKLVWAGTGLSLYLFALRGAPFPRAASLAALVLPATVFCVVAGQTGLFAGALLIGGSRLLVRAPVRAGALLGLLCLKPQLGVLVPLALIAARQGRALVAAAMTALAVGLASAIAFGPGLWRLWPGLASAMPRFMNSAYAPLVLVNKRPVVLTNLEALGLGHPLAVAGQVVAAAAIGVPLWRAFRRGITLRACAALWVGTFLATPYAAFYDEPLLGAAVLLEVALSAREERRFSAAELAGLAAAASLPLLLWLPPLPMAAPAVLACLFAIILRRDSYRSARPNSAIVQPIA